MTNPVSRRKFLKAAGVFTLHMAVGVHFAGRARAVAAITTERAGAPPLDLRGTQDEIVTLNAWLKISRDGIVTLAIPRADMGQGVRTSLAMLVAEELDVAWSAMQVEQAVADGVYGSMLTAGSSTIRQLYEPMRLIGATARHMMINAAASVWSAEAALLRTESGKVVAPDGRTLSYGELAATAATLAVPSRRSVTLKNMADFGLIGKPTTRIDNPDVVSGKAQYGIDVMLPGMLYATVVRCPVFGGKVASYDDSEVKAIPGVTAVVQIGRGVAVVGTTTWAALRGKRALNVTWDEGEHAALNSAQIVEQLRNAKTTPLPAPKNASAELDVSYELPLLAHATMEPMNCVADVKPDRAELWVGTQTPDGIQRTVSAVLGIPAKKITVHTTLLGGGFGRRVEMDYVTEAVEISRAVGAPVKVTWTRADDMQHGYYRPASVHRLRGGIDSSGNPAGWAHRITTTALGLGSAPAFVSNFLIAVGTETPYNLPNAGVDIQQIKLPFPVGFWRSVYASQNVFAVECFIDELAAAAGQDPYQYRRRLVKSDRLRAALDLAADKSGWGMALPAGRGRGIACSSEFDTSVATVVELSVDAQGVVKVHRVVSAVDCGVTVNPTTVEAQIMGAVVDGLATALKAEITLENGRVQQSSFRDYEWFRMRDMPEAIEVFLIPSSEPPGGIGEAGYPAAPPAVANALFAATGKRLRRLPLRAEDILRA